MKQSDFGLVLGPLVVTPDEVDPLRRHSASPGTVGARRASPAPFAWADAIALAARRTVLRPGDVIAGPPVATLTDIDASVRLEVEGIGTLDCPLA